MRETAVLTQSDYGKLLTDLKAIIQEGRNRVLEALHQENVRMYWEVGKRITQEHLTENAGYHLTMLRRLAEDLEVNYDTLRRSSDFFRAYSGGAPKGLTWSHYRELILLPDERERHWYAKQALKKGWTRNDLLRAIRRHAYAKEKRDARTPTPSKTLVRPQLHSFIYKARVERVVDADTLLVRIDLGFQVWKSERIRLAQIDVPPHETPKGKEAFLYVQDQLAQAPFVMIRTSRIDVHGRYVGDVFYSFHETERDKVFESGRYLNQELVDKGFAKVI